MEEPEYQRELLVRKGSSVTASRALLAREQELSRREAAAVEIEKQAVAVNELRRELEKHSQELMVKEAGIRELDRQHGALVEREMRVREAEIKIQQMETSVQKHQIEVADRENRLEEENRTRIVQFEQLVNPLSEREQRCLQKEQQIEELQQKTDNHTARETARVVGLIEELNSRDDQSKSLQRQAADSKLKIEKRESDLEAQTEEVAASINLQKKKTEELDQRVRAVEWKEKEAEQLVQRAAERELRLQEASELLDKQNEEYKQTVAIHIQQRAEINEIRLQLQARIQHVVNEERVVSEKRQNLDYLESKSTEHEKQLVIKLKEADAVKQSYENIDKQATAQLKKLTEREHAVTQKEIAVAKTNRKLRETEKELLAWMSETKWREDQIQRTLELENFSVLSVQGESDDASPSSKATNEALITHQLQSLKGVYLTSIHRQRHAKDTSSPTKLRHQNLFDTTLAETRAVHTLEKNCRGKGKILSKYLSRFQLLSKLGQKKNGLIATVTSTERTLLESLSEDDVGVISKALAREQEIAREMIFLRKMNQSPFASRLNCQTDKEVTTSVLQWYNEIRKELLSRYISLLSERDGYLSSVNALLEVKTEFVSSPEFPLSPVVLTELSTRNVLFPRVNKTVEARYKMLDGATCHGRTCSAKKKTLPPKNRTKPPTGSEVKTKRRLEPMTQVDHFLRLARVRTRPSQSGGNAAYLKYYFTPPPVNGILEAPGGDGGDSRPQSSSCSKLVSRPQTSSSCDDHFPKASSVSSNYNNGVPGELLTTDDPQTEPVQAKVSETLPTDGNKNTANPTTDTVSSETDDEYDDEEM